MKGQLSIQWLGQSCFRIDNGVNALVLDPYKEFAGYPPLNTQASYVLSSHAHGDHNYVSAVEITPPDHDPAFAFAVETVDSFHDDEGGAKRGPNLIHVIRTTGVSVVHLGDLGHLLSDEQARQIGHADVLLIPVGGFYTIDAAQAAQTVRQLHPDKVIPMHYRHKHGPDVLTTVDPFLEQIGDDYSVRHVGESRVHIHTGTDREVLVLTF